MSRILSCLLDEHAWYLVLVAMVLCGVASAGMYLLRRRARECGTQRRRVWRIAAATVGGLGFWADRKSVV